MSIEPTWRPTNSQYHEDDGRLSSSAIRLFLRSPALYRATYIDQTIEREETPAMVLGAALHLLLFGGGEIIRSGAEVRRGKRWEADLELAGPNDVVLPAPAWDSLRAMHQALLEDSSPAGELARELVLEGCGHPEWAHRFGLLGADCKVRVDRLRMLPSGRMAMVELKTTNDPRPHRYTTQVAELRYDVQAALYGAGVEDALGDLAFDAVAIHVVVGSSPPHEVAVYDLTPWAMGPGARDLGRAIEGILECRKEGRWYAPWQETPGGQIMQLDPPFWLRNML